ncbi:hypothetical protein ACTNDG_11475 [Clostridium sp. HCP1S3_B4]|uniref:hypothetical protein n=1 Tax=unclassified Clostridium TaxID=2614128 RepID=UPI003F8AB81F
MDREYILDDNKEYIHEESKTLLEEVRGFFQGKLKMVGIEWVSEKKGNDEEHSSTEATIFVIKNAKETPFEKCNGLDDVTQILNDFEESLITLVDNIDALIDNNKNLDAETKSSLESYASAVEKAVTIFGTQRKRRMPKISEMSSVAEIRDEIKHLISEIIANYVVTVLVDALYSRIKNGAGEVYELAIAEVNQFLASNGVVTKEIKVGEVLNPEYVEPTPDSTDNVTDEFVKFDTIEEIRRYPYFFNDGTKILDGTAKIWRRKD